MKTTWLWNSFQEYADYVSPADVIATFINALLHQTPLENLLHLSDTMQRFRDTHQEFKHLLQHGNRPHPTDAQFSELRDHVGQLVFMGDCILGYHKIIARSRFGSEFLSAKDIDEAQERYFTQKRDLYRHYTSLSDAITGLTGEFDAFVSHSAHFLKIGNVPPHLEADFIMARDLFSVGMDEAGVLIAGRGLEGILREIARMKEIRFGAPGSEKPAEDADFRDIVEVFYRLRFRKDKSRVIDQTTKAQLDLIRILRNSVAHPRLSRDENWREQATIIVAKAEHLWEIANRKRVGYVTRVVKKDW